MNAVMKFALACAGIATVSCGPSDKERALRELARDVNPLLLPMVQAATQILVAARNDYDTIIQACMSVDEELWILRDVKSAGWNDHTDPVGLHGRRLAKLATVLLDLRYLYCERGVPRELSLKKSCSDFCRDTWAGMHYEVRRLRREGETFGVKIVPLVTPEPSWLQPEVDSW